MRTGFPLPPAQLDGVVMSVPDTITAPGQPIRVRLHSVGQARTLVVGAYIRGRLADTQKVTVEAGQLAEAKLLAGSDSSNGRGGVVRITAFEEIEAKDGVAADLKPVAERLVFRKPGELLKLALAAPTETTTGAAVNLNITATDERGKSAAAVLWACAVNTGIAPGAKDRAMPTHFLLAGEVRNPDELEYADFLLTDHPKAAEALDLLLGTQGWRRFAEQAKLPNPANSKPPYYANTTNPELTRLMVQNGQYGVLAEQNSVKEFRKIAETYAPLYDAAVKAVAQAQRNLEVAHQTASDERDVVAARTTAEAAQRTADAKTATAEQTLEPVRRFRSGVWYAIAGLSGLALLCAGVSLVQPRTRLPLGISTLGSLGLVAFLFVAASWSDEAKATASTNEVARGEKNVPAIADNKNDKLAGTFPPRVKVEDPKSDVIVNSGNAGGGVNPNTNQTLKMTPGTPVPPTAPPPGAQVTPSTGVGIATGGGFNKPDAGFGGSQKTQPKENYTFNAVPPPVGLPIVRYSDKGAPGGGFPGAGGAGGGLGSGGAPFPSLPKPLPNVGAPTFGGPGVEMTFPAMPMGWDPKRPNGVSNNDLSQNKPSIVKMLRGSTGRTTTDAQAESVKMASDKAKNYANERAEQLANAIELYYAQRGKQGVPEGTGLGQQGGLLPERIEFFAVQHVRGAAPLMPPLVVREYAAPRPVAVAVPDEETPDTILWQPVIVLPNEGKASLNFFVGNAPGGYRITVAGHTADGRLGESRHVIVVNPPKTIAQPAQSNPVPPKGMIPQLIPGATQMP
jgi:hypothetical protein